MICVSIEITLGFAGSTKGILIKVACYYEPFLSALRSVAFVGSISTSTYSNVLIYKTKMEYTSI